MDPESAFYLGVNRNGNAILWYKGQSKKLTLTTTKIITNHSGRKTAITRLLDEGVALTSVQQHSGHKSIASLYNY